MIFYSINQVYSFLLIFSFGVFCSLFSSILGVFLLKNHHKIFFGYLFKIFLTIIFGIFIIFSVNLFYFGSFQPIAILSFTLGYVATNKTLAKTLDFLELKVYYIYNNIIKGVKSYLARKHKSIQD